MTQDMTPNITNSGQAGGRQLLALFMLATVAGCGLLLAVAAVYDFLEVAPFWWLLTALSIGTFVLMGTLAYTRRHPQSQE